VLSAALLAAAAGACAAAAITELVGAPDSAKDARRRRRSSRRRQTSQRRRLTALLIRLGCRAGAPAAPDALRARLAAAGTPLGLTAPDVMALKGAGALAGLLAAVALVSELPGRLGVAMLLCAPAAGFMAPDVALARRARQRAVQMSHELADVLDLLRVAIQAGLPVGRALGEVGRRCSGPLASELRGAAARIELGAPRAQALDELVERCPIAAAGTFAAAVARADRHGAALAPALEALSTDARAEQARRLRDQAARAAPKIQLVVALVLVPAVMLLVAAVLLQALGPVG